MSTKKQEAAVVGVGLAACAACCAGPILGVLTAIGLGTAAGVGLLGAGALVIGMVAATVVVVRRRRLDGRAPCQPARRRSSCRP